MGTCLDEDLVGWFCREVSISSKAASCCPRSAPGSPRFLAQSVTAPCPNRDTKPSRARQLPFENSQKIWWRLSCLQKGLEHFCCLFSLPFSSIVVGHVDDANCCPCVTVSDCEVYCEPVVLGTTPRHIWKLHPDVQSLGVPKRGLPLRRHLRQLPGLENRSARREGCWHMRSIARRAAHLQFP